MTVGSKTPGTSYGQILRSTYVIGGAQAISYVIGMIRVKLVAVLLGPSGVGLVGLFTSITSLISAISGLGIETSGVREVAVAHNSNNPDSLATTVKTLFRLCWIVGLLGWLLTAAISYPISIWVFDSSERAWAIALLGSTIFFGAVSAGRTSLMQGTRRIGDLARLNVLGAVVSTLVAVGLYGGLGQQGILPVLIITAAINLGVAIWFARRIKTVRVTQTWLETLKRSRRLISLGVVFVFGGVVAAVAALVIRTLVIRSLGLEAVGVYQAALALSGIFGNFILAAISADFYPRLSSCIDDKISSVKLVNEQIETGVLIAMPGMVATILYSSWLMKLFYSSEFVKGAEFLPWIMFSVFLGIVTSPMSYILLVKQSWQKYTFLVSGFHVLDMVCSLALLPFFGLTGIVIAHAIICAIYLLGLRTAVGPLLDFQWTNSALRLIVMGGLFMAFGLFVRWITPSGWGEIIGLPLVVVVSIFSLRGLSRRLGAEHRLISSLCRSRFGRFVCGL